MILYIETIFYICLIQKGILFLSMKHALFPERKFLRFSQVFKQKSQDNSRDFRLISPFLGKVWPIF
jgi:hypothetical protein